MVHPKHVVHVEQKDLEGTPANLAERREGHPLPLVLLPHDCLPDLDRRVEEEVAVEEWNPLPSRQTGCMSIMRRKRIPQSAAKDDTSRRVLPHSTSIRERQKGCEEGMEKEGTRRMRPHGKASGWGGERRPWSRCLRLLCHTTTIFLRIVERGMRRMRMVAAITYLARTSTHV